MQEVRKEERLNRKTYGQWMQAPKMSIGNSHGTSPLDQDACLEDMQVCLDTPLTDNAPN